MRPSEVLRRLDAAAHRVAARHVRGRRALGWSPGDLASEVLTRSYLRFAEGRAKGPRRAPSDSTAAAWPVDRWLGGIARNVVREELRRRRERGPSARRLPPPPRSTPAADPATASEAADLHAHLRRWMRRELPAPFREIAAWKFLDGWARPEIVRRLRLWRPVGRSAALRLISQTHSMLRRLRDGGHPRDDHPRRYDPRFNPWLSRPKRR